MDRRGFMRNLALGILVVPRAARAQSSRRIHRIGILGNNSATADKI